jgi:glycosyltransferase involved in cell wall biosynthesis
MKKINILIIGADLTSNGGIASVIKCYNREWKKYCNNINLYLLKTSYYKDKKPVFEIFLFIKAFLKAYVIITKKSIHIVHIHSSSGYSFFRKSIFLFLSKIFLKKVIFHIHASRFYDFFLTKNIFLKFYIYQILKLSDLTLTLCYDWEKRLNNNYPDINIQTLHNPIEIVPNAYIKSTESSDVLKILFLGFLIKSKGILDILEIAKKFAANDINDIKFIIAGKGDLENTLNDIIEKYCLNNIVKYVGWVTGSRKAKLLENSDLLFLPSYNEGMPISILEAMSFSLPIISTRISGIPDLVIHGLNGYIYNPGQINQFYKKLIELYYNRNQLYILGKNSLKRSKLFSSGIIFKKLVEIYFNIMQ